MAPKKERSEQVGAGKEGWTEEHTNIMLRGIITQVLIHRPDIYSIPELNGVSENGGDRINKKIQQALKKVCDGYPGAQGIVEDVVKGLKGSKAAANIGGGGDGSVPNRPKKRKVKDEEQ
ncbi:hypothetical protein I316_01407 [Kwoniella heveanensis BCC8398]|uniref:Uncharacterized protein n=1 Tax=Kwoniella heveanensis BCC8398 TaxID=1296120 RepID=A0A1B9H0L1_9TREE|nr:hypothetical protein I316_01407 [Kwoniella heveanensis BCC8398]